MTYNVYGHEKDSTGGCIVIGTVEASNPDSALTEAKKKFGPRANYVETKAHLEMRDGKVQVVEG